MVKEPPSNGRKPRSSRPLDKARLEELALAYVARFATSAARLESYLARKLRERGWAGEHAADLPALVGREADKVGAPVERRTRREQRDRRRRPAVGARKAEEEQRGRSEFRYLDRVENPGSPANYYLNDVRGKLNLIVYNPAEGAPYAAPTEDDVLAFEQYLWKRKITAILRKSKGQDIKAACGQLKAARLPE